MGEYAKIIKCWLIDTTHTMLFIAKQHKYKPELHVVLMKWPLQCIVELSTLDILSNTDRKFLLTYD